MQFVCIFFHALRRSVTTGGLAMKCRASIGKGVASLRRKTWPKIVRRPLATLSQVSCATKQCHWWCARIAKF